MRDAFRLQFISPVYEVANCESETLPTVEPREVCGVHESENSRDQDYIL